MFKFIQSFMKKQDEFFDNIQKMQVKVTTLIFIGGVAFAAWYWTTLILDFVKQFLA